MSDDRTAPAADALREATKVLMQVANDSTGLLVGQLTKLEAQAVLAALAAVPPAPQHCEDPECPYCEARDLSGAPQPTPPQRCRNCGSEGWEWRIEGKYLGCSRCWARDPVNGAAAQPTPEFFCANCGLGKEQGHRDWCEDSIQVALSESLVASLAHRLDMLRRNLENKAEAYDEMMHALESALDGDTEYTESPEELIWRLRDRAEVAQPTPETLRALAEQIPSITIDVMGSPTNIRRVLRVVANALERDALKREQQT